MSLLALAFAGLIVLLYVRALNHSVNVRREWEFICAPWSASVWEGLEAKAASETAVMRSAFRRAMISRADGSREEAHRLVDVVLGIVERSAPEWDDVLASVILLSRMADAVTPIPPLTPWTYRLFPVSWLALVGMILHHLTITTGERLRLRAYILRGSWRIIRRTMRTSSARIRRKDAASAWERLDAARTDLATVSEETVRSFRAALLSLDARPASAAVTVPR